MTTFNELKLAQPILRAITDEGYTTPTPIQAKAIPPMIEGRDVLGIAQTGTGKTAAFSLPILHRLTVATRKAQPRKPFVLILAPTRELAGQINDSIRDYGKHASLRSAVVFGGASIRPQIKALDRGVHILVATPGRLMDLMNQGCVRLDNVEVFVLDEADRMLDMGFIRDVTKIAQKLPRDRQTVLFSATMPTAVQGLAGDLLNDPIKVEVTPAATTVEKIEQRLLYVAKDDKRALLTELLNDDSIYRVLVFTRTKHGADKVVRHLHQNKIKSDAIHGNKAQNARQRALRAFRSGETRVLVATDIAARGIDVDGITHVINFDLPDEAESYVHRIGRTARAGATGIAISFCAYDERGLLRDVEKCIRQSVPVFEDHPYHSEEIANDTSNQGSRPKRGGGQRNGNRNGGRNGQKHGHKSHKKNGSNGALAASNDQSVQDDAGQKPANEQRKRHRNKPQGKKFSGQPHRPGGRKGGHPGGNKGGRSGGRSPRMAA